MTCTGPLCASSSFIVTELLQLINLGIPVAHITWPRVSMISDKWISICHGGHSKRLTSGHTTAVTVLNLHHTLPQTWEANTTCAKMNPVNAVIALRAGQMFQIFNLETRKCCKKYKMSSNVDFWTWIDHSVIAIVTDIAVYHWDTENCDVPRRIFYRDARLTNAQVVNCIVDPTFNWLAVTGLFLEENRVAGITQVYSVVQNLSQTFEAHWVNIIYGKLQTNHHPTPILVVANRCWGKSGKLHVVELGPKVAENSALSFHTECFEFTDPWDRYDFPISIQVSLPLSLIYVVTKFGYLYLFDLETAIHLSSLSICPDIVFAATLNESQGIFVISRNGQVLSVDLKKEQLIKNINNVMKKPHIAERLRKSLENI